MADKKKNVLAGITGAIRGYGKTMADRTNIMAQLAANQIELKDNWLFKMQQQQAQSQWQQTQQQQQNQQVQQAYQGGAQKQGYEMGYGKEGNPELTAPSQDIYKRKFYEAIQAKKARGEKLDKLDEEFLQSYLGVGKGTEMDTYRQDIRNAMQGDLSWDDVKFKYPDREDKVEEMRRASLPKLKRSPGFRTGRGLPAFFSKDVAKMNKETLKVVEQIETDEDLQELLEREDEARIKGIDTDAILEYFGKTKEEMVNASAQF